tara:strand:+ start:473 stop:1300 length:828 start_codon:yes stop_codon:yes gene_type:complete
MPLENLDRKDRMKTRLGMLSAAILMASPCLADESRGIETTSVQWTVEEGGNGHWYQCVRLGYAPEHPGTSWTWCREQAELTGGHLATITSVEEDNWVRETVVMPMEPPYLESAPQLGGWKVDGQWQWITGEPWTYDGFGPSEPSNDGDRLEYWRWCCLWWNDRPDGFSDSIHTYLIEWEADCNGDGIVDYGQILDGTYDDFDGNGILDCCEDDGNCELCTADVYPDGTIDISDLLIVIAYYGLLEPAAGDVNLDGQVDSMDILGVLDQWGTCDAP